MAPLGSMSPAVRARAHRSDVLGRKDYIALGRMQATRRTEQGGWLAGSKSSTGTQCN